jgi:hypothetical protein
LEVAIAKITESTPQRLAMQFSSNTLVLDKGTGTATLQRKMMFWSRKPIEKPLSEIANIDPPPLKWSDLRYVFDIQEDRNGKEAIQA